MKRREAKHIKHMEIFPKDKYHMFILEQFQKRDCRGIECECMFNMAAEAGLYEKGTYGSKFSDALQDLCDIFYKYDEYGKWIYNVFVLREDY